MSGRRAPLWPLGIVGAASIVAAVVLPLRFAHPYWSVLVFLLLQPIPVLAAGAFAYRRAPSHPTVRRLFLTGSLYGLSLGFEAALGAAYASQGAFRGFWFADLVTTSIDVLAILFAVRFFALFPHGYSERRHERVILAALWVFAFVPLVAIMAGPSLPFPKNVWLHPPGVASPFAVSSSLGDVARGLYDGRIQLLFVGLLLLVLRFRRSSIEQRQQIKWVLDAVALMGVVQAVPPLLAAAGVIPASAPSAVGPYLQTPILTVTLVAAAVALFRHHALDIDLVIRRSVVFGVLWVAIGAAYVGVASALGIAASHRLPVGAAVVVTVIATLAFGPVHRRLERVANRLVFGVRMSGYELLTRFGETLEHAFDAGELAPRIAMAVRDGLALQWARVSLALQSDGGALARAGAAGIGLDEEAAAEITLPLRYGPDRLGALECGPKTEGKFGPADHELLATIARQAAMGIHNGRLASELSARLAEIRRQADELSASRGRLVQAQDIERRRLERNIHDGVQQQLVSLAANIRLARNQLRRDPDVADATLAALQHEAGLTLDDLRELAQGIHPSVLVDRGLVEAVEARASRVPIGVAIDAEPNLRGARFAEETETAAYFLVSEGLANVLKHAMVSRAEVRIRLERGQLVVEVSDQGVGFVPGEASGSGLSGLRDRIEAVGGALRIVARPDVGTTLIGELPARAREPSGV